MKKKIDYKIILIIFLTLVFALLCYLYYRPNNNLPENFKDKFNYNSEKKETNEETTTESISFTTTSQVASSLTEELPLRTGYYFKKMLVTDNVVIKKGTKIIEYTNGKYLTAPYDLIITSYNIPNAKKKCTNSHSITVAAFNVLSAEFRIDESKIDYVSIGKKVKVKIPALNDREIEGIITDITSTASNGKFTATVEFDNDGDIKLGMTINIII